MLAIYTSGRSWARFASGAIRLPAYHAKGVTSTCVMHSCIPNSQLLVRSSPTSCTRRETPSARVKTAFCAMLAMGSTGRLTTTPNMVPAASHSRTQPSSTSSKA
ncbi:Uncharacterised protein [Alistipes sp. cv1]|nr:Uncharacterised protein [Faecalibacterium prausnitzii]